MSPFSTPKACKPGCRGVVRAGVCSVCGPRTSRPAFDRPAGTTTERGYGWSWQKLRERFLAERPTCSCGDPATDVDHIVPKAHGGTDDESNLQPLCRSCHRRKTGRDGSMRASA